MSQLFDGGHNGERVESSVQISVPAEPEQLSVVRAVAGALAAQRDFDLDAIADLRLAVDEACTRLIRHALPGSTLECRFTLDGPALRFRADCRVDGDNSSLWSERSFGWHVLRTLTEDLATQQEPIPETDRDRLLVVEFAARTGGPDE